jgi:hypothetical protein
MAKRKQAKSFFKMTPAEREADVAKYDKGVPFEETRELSAAESADWEQMRAAGRPRKASDEVSVVIRMNSRLLSKAIGAARRDGKSLSDFISELLAKSQRRAG